MSECSDGLKGTQISSLDSRHELYKNFRSLYYKEDMPKRLQKLNDLPLNMRTYFLTEKMEEVKEVLDPVEKAFIGMTGGSEDDGTSAAIANTIKTQTAASFISKIHMFYMNADQDIKWRLGDVVKTATDPRSVIISGKEAGVTDDNGCIYTQANFYKKYLIPTYGSSTPREEYYTNFYFPPFIRQEDIRDTASLNSILEKQKKKDKNALKKARETGGSSTFLHWEKMLAYRGNFTERKPAFKTINDSISYLQWLFERVSGITSTYLTDWDLSLYYQENIFKEDNIKAKWMPLTYRIIEDNPLYDGKSGFSKAEGDPLGFGVINCAVSKLKGYNKEPYYPEGYPLSTNWCRFPLWAQRASQSVQSFNGEYDKIFKYNSDGSPKYGADGKPEFWTSKHKVLTPAFYARVLNPSDIIDRENSLPIKTRILFDDYQGAALAGWQDMRPFFYKTLYSTPEDGLSGADIRCLDAGEGFTKAEDIIAANFADNWNANVYDPDGPTDDVLGVYNDLTDMSSVDYDLSDGAGRRSAKRKRGNMNGAATAKADQNRGIQSSTQDEVTGEYKASQADKVLGIAPENCDTSNPTGICQRTPALYGGPHGYCLSPLATQSYIESNNALLRNTPRIAPIQLGKVDPSTGIPTVSNLYAKDDHFFSEQVPGDSMRPEFIGAEKFYSHSGPRNSTDVRSHEHSFTQGIRFLRDGLHDKSVKARAIGLERIYSNYQKVLRSRESYYYCNYGSSSSPCKHYTTEYWYEYPSYDKGHPIHYIGGGYFQNGWVIGEILPDHLCVYANQHFSRGGRCQEVGGYDDVRWNGWTWIGDRRDNGGRTGYIEVSHEYEYDKYRLHSMPYEHWRLHKVRHEVFTGWGSYTVTRTRRRWWNWWGWSRRYGYYTETTTHWYKKFEPEEDYELTFPESWGIRARSAYTNWGWTNLWHSAAESNFTNKMLDINGTRNANAFLIFLEGNNSLSDRKTRGPKRILQMPVTHRDYRFTYKVEHCSVDGCGNHDHWTTWHKGYDDYLSVKVENALAIFDGLQDPVFTNNKIGLQDVDFIEASTVTPNSPGRIQAPTPDVICHTVPGKYFVDPNGNMEYTNQGFEGYGILSCIPGIDVRSVKDNPPIENYAKYLGLQADQDMLNSKALKDLPFKVYETGAPRTAEHWENNRKWLSADYAPPVIYTYDMDPALKACWVRACTRGTFYIDEQFSLEGEMNGNPSLDHYWQVPIDVPLRTFYFQLLYQKVYLEALKELMCSHLSEDFEKYGIEGNPASDYLVDFKTLGKLLHGDENGPGVCGSKVYYLSNPNKNFATKLGNGEIAATSEVYGFNQWIREGRRTFEKYNDTTPQGNQLSFKTKLEARISLFDSAIKAFEKHIQNEAEEFSYNELYSLNGEITKVVQTELNPSQQFIERTMYAYMNILYEYRRYFINKRCNKEDGTLWMIRCLEQAMPLVLASTITIPPSPTVDTVSERLPQKVAFYSFQNNNSKKLNAIYSGKTLPEDKIEKVFVKVQYTTKEEYLKDKEAVANGDKAEPSIIKIKRRKFVRDEKTGHMLYDAKGNLRTEELGDFVYAKKPSNGVYRLESKEILTNLANIKYNNSLKPDEKDRLKPVEDYDLAYWPITWGLPSGFANEKEKGTTPIIFDLYDAIDLGRALEIIDGYPDASVEDVVCAGRVPSDYWEVKVATVLPRPDGYETKIRLVPYTEVIENSPVTHKSVQTETRLVDNAIWPIIEKQKYTGDVSPESLIQFQVNNSKLPADSK